MKNPSPQIDAPHTAAFGYRCLRGRIFSWICGNPEFLRLAEIP